MKRINLKKLSIAMTLVFGLGLTVPQNSVAAPIYTTTVLVVGDTLFNVTKTGAAPSDSLAWTASIGNASSVVNSGPGVIRAHAKSQLTLTSDPSSTLSVYSQAMSRFRDAFVVSAKDDTGVEIPSGFLTAKVLVHADASLSPALGADTLFSSVLWAFTVGSASRNGRALASLPFGNSSSVSGGEFEVLIPWSAGSPIGIDFQTAAEAQVGAQTTGTRTAVADFSNSMAWGGITSVTDSTGASVVQFNALNDLGDSYIGPAIIPEPTTYALALLGLFCFIGRRRK